MPRNRFTAKIAIYVFLTLAVLGVRWLASSGTAVEHWYSSTSYPRIATLLRTLTGWVPFSLGDLLYLAFGSWLLYRLIRTLIRWRKGSLGPGWGRHTLHLTLVTGAVVYLWFNLAWGLNYNRQGIAFQLDLKVDSATREQVDTLARLLLDKTNQLSLADVHHGVKGNAALRQRALAIYDVAAQEHEFLQYQPASFKTSLFGVVGNYVGYSGYYNPFTGEAQVNDRVPAFSQPYVALHEIGHQLGYAKENEANFVGYLAARASRDTAFLYSTYFDLFLYANAALRGMDSARARENIKRLDPAARKDLEELRAFARKYESPIDRMVDVFYDHFLRMNQQPLGQRTYSQVVLWMVAYREKYGGI